MVNVWPSTRGPEWMLTSVSYMAPLPVMSDHVAAQVRGVVDRVSVLHCRCRRLDQPAPKPVRPSASNSATPTLPAMRVIIAPVERSLVSREIQPNFIISSLTWKTFLNSKTLNLRTTLLRDLYRAVMCWLDGAANSITVGTPG